MVDASDKLKVALESAVRNAIKAMGAAQFRQTSFFVSNLKKDMKQAA